MFGKPKFQKILPVSLFKTPNLKTNGFFGATSKNEKQLLKNIVNDTNPVFFKWALDKILCWPDQSVIHPLFHIHGEKDRILPLFFISYDVKIKNGGHLMILNKAEELNKILKMNLR